MARAAASVGFSLLMLVGALAVAAAQEDKACCLYGECGGRCKDGVGADNWCGQSEEHCGQCSGVWCLGGAGDVPIEEESQPLSKAPAMKCCYWSPTGDMCGNCQSGAQDGEWCAQSEDQCATCTGTWCGEPKVYPSPLPGVPIPSPDPKVPITDPEPPVQRGEWIEGFYTTGYWDCCKPSCSWRGKGLVNKPVPSCHADGTTAGLDEDSVCMGGTAAACLDQQPWAAGPNLSFGFAAAAVGGPHGLKGDENCGQCFELLWTPQKHDDQYGIYGGAHPDLVGATHVVQVTNIGEDIFGDHIFDLQIPSAGQGLFFEGCPLQFPGYKSGDFDCDNLYGGCSTKEGCARLPEGLHPGCNWRFDYYKWFDGAMHNPTNNPYVRVRRVKCPKELVDITGTVPDDDDRYPEFGT